MTALSGLLLLAPACARKPAPASGGASEPPAPSASAAVLGAQSASGAAPAPSEQPAVVILPVDAGPPRQVLSAEGIAITETGTGEVLIKTSSLWGETLDLRYADCSYFKSALPVLERQLSKERFALLGKVCKKK